MVSQRVFSPRVGMLVARLTGTETAMRVSLDHFSNTQVVK